jgi:hypothetical protein
MAIRKEIASYTLDGYDISLQYDGGMEPGGEQYIVISKDGERLISRTFYFDSFSEQHARNFAEKFATDEDYRKRCLEGEVTWARVQEAYKEHSRKVYSVFEPLGSHEWGAAYDEAKELATAHCQDLFDTLSTLFEKVEDPTPETVKTLVARVRKEAKKEEMDLREKYAPYPPDHEITFGKYAGKTLLEIAGEDPDYAKWAVEEMNNRPKVKGGFKKALLKVGEISS